MVVGILGGGQLAQMIAHAGKNLDCQFIFLDPNKDACAFPLGKSLIGAYDDPKLLEKLALESDIVTFEFENVPFQSVEILSKHVQINPNAKALEISQDRLKEKQSFTSLGIPTTLFASVDSLEDLKKGVEIVGLPCVLKTRSQGYDGKGQKVLRTKEDVDVAWKELGGKPLVVEEFIKFSREVSQVAARNPHGDIQFYSISENEHAEGILRLTLNRPNDPAQEQAQSYARKLMEHMNYVGVFALELFQKGGQLLANEMAPRVHNSGHWTIEGAKTSQFENHLRSVLDMPLGETADIGFSAMVNCIGTMPSKDDVAKIPNTHYHAYGKAPRPGRKVGHITIRCSTQAELEKILPQVRKLV